MPYALLSLRLPRHAPPRILLREHSSPTPGLGLTAAHLILINAEELHPATGREAEAEDRCGVKFSLSVPRGRAGRVRVHGQDVANHHGGNLAHEVQAGGGMPCWPWGGGDEAGDLGGDEAARGDEC